MSDGPKLRETLPTSWYLDEDHYRRELDAIWYRDWIAVGREEQIPETGNYFVARVGTQQVIVTRNADGELRAFHNTCRHRGSILCTESQGKFRNGRIICPYHTWTYGLDGDLLATPLRVESDDFRFEDYPLYDVHVESWGGFIFVCLAEDPEQSLQEAHSDAIELLDGWPLTDMVIAHEETKELACNWKVFWENYNECYHCPRIHPELCKVVPTYKKGVFADYQLEGGNYDTADRLTEPGVAEGMTTWTMDGNTLLPDLPGVDPDKKKKGMWFSEFLGSMFVVGHPQYVRSVRVSPRARNARS